MFWLYLYAAWVRSMPMLAMPPILTAGWRQALNKLRPAAPGSILVISEQSETGECSTLVEVTEDLWD